MWIVLDTKLYHIYRVIYQVYALEDSTSGRSRDGLSLIFSQYKGVFLTKHSDWGAKDIIHSEYFTCCFEVLKVVNGII